MVTMVTVITVVTVVTMVIFLLLWSMVLLNFTSDFRVTSTINVQYNIIKEHLYVQYNNNILVIRNQ